MRHAAPVVAARGVERVDALVLLELEGSGGGEISGAEGSLGK